MVFATNLYYLYKGLGRTLLNPVTTALSFRDADLLANFVETLNFRNTERDLAQVAPVIGNLDVDLAGTPVQTFGLMDSGEDLLS